MKLEDLQDRQEIQVINYLHDMLELSGGGKLDEYRFMPTVRNLELFGKLARFLKVNADKGVLRDMDLLVGFEVCLHAPAAPAPPLPRRRACAERGVCLKEHARRADALAACRHRGLWDI